ncbi:MAG: hypothetical protein RLZZ511_2894 [Cyanobacteriota bacterium]
MRNLCALKVSAVVTIGGLAAMPSQAQQVILTPNGTMIMPTQSDSSSPLVQDSPAMLTPIAESSQSDEEFLVSPIGVQARREQLKLVISNPEIYSLNPRTWGQPVKDVVDAQGNVVMSKQGIMAYRANQAQIELDGLMRNMEFTIGDQYEALGFIPGTIDQVIAGKSDVPDAAGQAQFYRQLIIDRNIPDPGDFVPLTATNVGDAPLSGTNVLSVAPSLGTVSATAVSPATIAVSPTRPTATIQGSQNPTADFAAANGFDRSRLPAQLNRQLMESPLSNSRVFPGMQ